MRRALAAGGIAAALLIAACGSDDGATAPVPSVDDPTGEVTTSDLPRELIEAVDDPRVDARILLDEADELERNGFWEEAADLRRRILDVGPDIDPALVESSRLDQVRVLLRLERPAAAEAELARVDDEALPPEQRPVWRILRGRTFAALGDLPAAVAEFSAYLEESGAAASSVRLLLAPLYSTLDNGDDAIRTYREIIDDPTAPAWDVEAALLQLGLLHENRGEYEDAAEQYQRLYEVSPWSDDDTFALHRLGEVLWWAGDEDGAAAAWLRLIEDYSWHWRAAEAYDGLVARGTAIPPNLEGLILYRQFALSDAQQVFADNLSRDLPHEEEAVSRYYLAAISEDLDEDPSAIVNYLRSVSLDRDGPLADDALWWAAGLLAERDQLGLAAATYQRLAAEFPQSEFAARAATLAGLMTLEYADAAAAEARFLAVARSAPDLDTAQRAWLWVGKVRQAMGDADGAALAFHEAISLDPVSYAGLRAEANLRAATFEPALDVTVIGAHPAEPDSSLDWIASFAGPEPTDAPPLSDRPGWRAAVEAEQAGMRQSASVRFGDLIAAAGDNPWTLYRMGQELDDLGVVHRALDVGERLLALAPPLDRSAAPVEILRWAYPQGWPTLAQSEAAEAGVDELLLYALIRQESRFNPDAGSVAGALGLTQVIPPTAQDIARALADSTFEIDLLFRPALSIEYGAFYLGQQLRAFDGAAWLALAAYNGGPGNADRWSGGDTSIDPDLFFEQITFGETREYVRRVLENYAWYQFIYRGTATPTLLSASAVATP